MIAVSKTSIWAVLSGIVGLCFLGYFVFLGFEYHKDQEIKSNRLKKRLATMNDELKALVHELESSALTNSQINQQIFTLEVNMGESYLEHGDVARSIEHLTNAMVLCNKPTVLYKVLERKLPKHVFDMLKKKLEAKPSKSLSSS
uniref:Mitochondrial import receptor subunit TOM20 n=1 Tax=Schizaphis graminum TaxID=13262 RepID=A0A2S2PNR6_SCHGA